MENIVYFYGHAALIYATFVRVLLCVGSPCGADPL